MKEPKKKQLERIEEEVAKLTVEEENESAAKRTSKTSKSKAQKLLELIYTRRKGRKFELVQIDSKTWKEVEVKNGKRTRRKIAS